MEVRVIKMGIRSKIRTRRAHYHVLGKDGIRFLNSLKKTDEGDLVSFNVKGYQNRFYIRAKTSDVPTFYQCIYNKEYDFNFDIEPKTIIDLGANIGLTTCFFKMKYPNSMIVAVEPEQTNFDILRKNTKDLSDVHCVQAGIWNKDANLIVEDNGQGHYGFTVKEVSVESSDSIKAISINGLIEKFALTNIDVLKIDIEGAEKELFESNTEWLSKVRHIIIEFHDRMKPGCSKAFFKELVKHNFEFSIKGENILCTLINSGPES